MFLKFQQSHKTINRLYSGDYRIAFYNCSFNGPHIVLSLEKIDVVCENLLTFLLKLRSNVHTRTFKFNLIYSNFNSIMNQQNASNNNKEQESVSLLF